MKGDHFLFSVSQRVVVVFVLFCLKCVCIFLKSEQPNGKKFAGLVCLYSHLCVVMVVTYGELGLNISLKLSTQLTVNK